VCVVAVQEVFDVFEILAYPKTLISNKRMRVFALLLTGGCCGCSPNNLYINALKHSEKLFSLVVVSLQTDSGGTNSRDALLM
jgi:hypothetical protein